MVRPLAALLLLCLTFGSAHAEQVRKFVVYFQEWSAAIDPAAQEVIDQVATLGKSERGTIRVVGFADPTGSKAANILLSELRAQRVVDQLADAGVAPARLVLRGKGPVQFAISALESRRVEISFQKP